MIIKKINFDDIKKQEELELDSTNKYELLKNGLDEVLNSSAYEELKDIKLNITYRELQLDNIDNNIENIDIEALSKMKKYTSNLGIELTEVFEKELNKTPETALDNIIDLNETLEFNIEALKEKEEYIENSILFAKNFNELAISNIENEYDRLPEEARNIFDKNEELLFITNDAFFVEDKFEYANSIPDITKDVDRNFELIKNDFDIAVRSYEHYVKSGGILENDNYLRDKLIETMENIAIYTIDDKNPEHTVEARRDQFGEYLKEQDNYIQTNIPNIDNSLINLLENIRTESLEKESPDKAIDQKDLSIENEVIKEKETVDDEFTLF